MTPTDRLKDYPIHDSMRGCFGHNLYKNMAKNKDIVLVVGDLGYKLFDPHFEDFPGACINCGAAEQSMMGIACGLALSGKIPVVYSITPFLVYRPFETIRNYVDKERLNVKMVGSGRDKDYAHDGFSHDASDVKPILDTFGNIKQYYPEDKVELETAIVDMFSNFGGSFLSLSR